ncbi:HAD family hydrolase [Magnetococcus sp. PR-3]|uniref:HAD family hydrolase n=1 Tax=Magnetococcus sp. PR-3 TaxID=3120355 RepID=UPI002FCE1F54
MTTKRGLFLDLDGTLADSLPVMRGIYGAFLAHYGVQGCDEEFQRLNGPPLNKVCEYLKQTHGLVEGLALLQARYEGLLKEAPAQISPAQGAKEVLEWAKQKGWSIVVVTSSAHAHTQTWLEQCALSPWIDGIVGGDDVVQGKPHPEPYLQGINMIQADIDRSLAVEDSLQGAQAALQAGLKTLRILPEPSHASGVSNLYEIASFQQLIKHL